VKQKIPQNHHKIQNKKAKKGKLQRLKEIINNFFLYTFWNKVITTRTQAVNQKTTKQKETKTITSKYKGISYPKKSPLYPKKSLKTSKKRTIKKREESTEKPKATLDKVEFFLFFLSELFLVIIIINSTS